MADGAWHRVHPLTPAIRSWQALVVVLIVVVQDAGQNAIRQAAGSDLGEGGPDAAWLRGAVPVGALVLVLIAGMLALSWRMTRYRVTAEALELRHGVIVRRQRRARLDRLQAVDLVQPLVARIFGLARLKLEVAGGSGSSIELSYLTDTQARQLRNHLLAAAAGLTYETPHAPEAPEHPIAEVPVPRLIASLLLDGGVLAGVVTVTVVVAAGLAAAGIAAFAGLLPAALGVVTVLWRRFASAFGFTVTVSPDGLRLRHGLLERRAQTVPPGRVQAIQLSQPLLWRGRDWWRVVVNVAGYAGRGDNQRTENELLPVGTRAEAVALLALVVPDLGIEPGEDALAVVGAGLDGDSGRRDGYLTSPRQARWVDPLAWRRNGVRVTREVLLVRRGRLRHRLDVVPHARTQSCGISQGPLQRLFGVVSFHLHSTRGPIDPVVPHLRAPDADDLLADQAVRARHARRLAPPERWLERSDRTGQPSAGVTPPTA
ncbi:MAG: PH domain-containing protein [Kineosporiaceae bacterium]